MTAFTLAGNTLSRRTWALMVVFGLLTATAAAKDMALISNKNNSLPPIAMPDLVRVCKGQMAHWPDGKPVTLVMRPPGAADMKIVEEKIYVTSSEDVRSLISSANHN